MTMEVESNYLSDPRRGQQRSSSYDPFGSPQDNDSLSASWRPSADDPFGATGSPARPRYYSEDYHHDSSETHTPSPSDPYHSDSQMLEYAHARSGTKKPYMPPVDAYGDKRNDFPPRSPPRVSRQHNSPRSQYISDTVMFGENPHDEVYHDSMPFDQKGDATLRGRDEAPSFDENPEAGDDSSGAVVVTPPRRNRTEPSSSAYPSNHRSSRPSQNNLPPSAGYHYNINSDVLSTPEQSLNDSGVTESLIGQNYLVSGTKEEDDSWLQADKAWQEASESEMAYHTNSYEREIGNNNNRRVVPSPRGAAAHRHDADPLGTMGAPSYDEEIDMNTRKHRSPQGGDVDHMMRSNTSNPKPPSPRSILKSKSPTREEEELAADDGRYHQLQQQHKHHGDAEKRSPSRKKESPSDKNNDRKNKNGRKKDREGSSNSKSNRHRSSRNRARSPELSNRTPEDEDDSLANDYGVRDKYGMNSTKSRTQKAFNKRANSREKKRDHNHSKNRHSSVESSGAGGGVTFDNKRTVHHYERDDSTLDTGYTGGSMESSYSKSMESEVEDLVKDLFFVGNGNATHPGRRKIQHSSQPKRKYANRSSGRSAATPDEQDETTLGDSTMDTYDESTTLNTYDESTTLNTLDDGYYEESTAYTGEDTFTTARGTNATSTLATETVMTGMTEDDDDDDPFNALWKSIETGMKDMFGLASGEDESRSSSSKSRSNPCKSNDVTKTAEEDHKDKNLLDYASEMILGSEGANDSKMKPCSGGGGDALTRDVSDARETENTSLEDDARLLQLAQYAARSMHEVNGIVFDESCEIDIMSEVKFSVVTVILPMGILFQENGGGCWVMKVFPTGNAALHAKGGTVEVGDQLAAINGLSAINMKVDKICALVSEVPQGDEIELTFLRYTGPMRPAPGTVAEEGYEVDLNQTTKKKGFFRNRSFRGKKEEEERAPAANPTPVTPPTPEPAKEKKKKFRLFGRGKK